jgi:methylenetetrahydrofolate dehydrogenase (NADP+)/methenyltetrahydrofolate cyclohydrolase
MECIDGKKIAEEIKLEIASEVAQRIKEGKKIPHLAAVIVGHDGASETYVANKVKACGEVGFHSTLVRFEDTITEAQLLEKVDELNHDPEIDGFIVQVPLPSHISETRITEAISPAKDVDGFHPMNLGRMIQGLPSYVSATPLGVMELLRRYHIPTQGKKCVVLGRSNNVGTPLSILLSRKGEFGDATVTLCHSKTPDIASYTREADIVIVAMGRPRFLTADMVKEGAVVIDIGITRVPSTQTKSGFKLAGDVDFDNVAPRCSYISPVPGGVGPMTIVSLLKNTLLAARGEVYTEK